MAISKRLRYEILRRDGFTCRYCGHGAPDVPLTVDHVVPTALGGNDHPSNLVTACRDCNSGKSATPADAALVDDVAEDALRWAAAIRQATARALADRNALIDVEQAVWTCFEGLTEYLPADWYTSVDQFHTAGLAREELVDAAYLAINARHVHSASMWRYFAGICHRKIDDRHQAARQIIAQDVH